MAPSFSRARFSAHSLTQHDTCILCSSWRLVNPLNAKLNPICHLLALLGAHHILHVSRIRVKMIIASKIEFTSSDFVVCVHAHTHTHTCSVMFYGPFVWSSVLVREVKEQSWLTESPLRRQRSALDCSATEEEEEENLVQCAVFLWL